MTVTDDGGGAFCFSFVPSAAAFAAFGAVDVGIRELVDGGLDVARRRAAAEAALHVLDLLLEQMARRKRLREERVGDDLVALQRVTAFTDLDVVRDRADEARQLGEREVVRDLILERAHELLLAGEPVEVGVGVAEPDEVERLLAVEPLVARLQVDVRVVVVGRAGVLVVVAAVDVHPDAVQLVDDFLEAVEVDGDQVVDRQRRSGA